MALALRKEHLRNLLLQATAKGQMKQIKDLKAIMAREGIKKMWWSINHSMRDWSGRSVTWVEQVVDGQVVEHTTEDAVI
jgi:hypothetical protein